MPIYLVNEATPELLEPLEVNPTPKLIQNAQKKVNQKTAPKPKNRLKMNQNSSNWVPTIP